MGPLPTRVELDAEPPECGNTYRLLSVLSIASSLPRLSKARPRGPNLAPVGKPVAKSLTANPGLATPAALAVGVAAISAASIKAVATSPATCLGIRIPRHLEDHKPPKDNTAPGCREPTRRPPCESVLLTRRTLMPPRVPFARPCLFGSSDQRRSYSDASERGVLRGGQQ